MTLTPWLLRQAYAQGLFPMTDDDGVIRFYKSTRRALFPMTGAHVSRSLRRTMRLRALEIAYDQDFEATVRACIRPEWEGNWIGEDLIRLYLMIHREGWAHSVEVRRDGLLVGGLYGVAIGTCFCAESMFHRETDMSKVALVHAVDHCRELGFTMFDAQVMNPHLARMGAVEVSEAEYSARLSEALTASTPWS